MRQPKPPCTRDCPERSIVCHNPKICPKWGQYQRDYAAWREFLRKNRREEGDYEGVRKANLKGRDPI